MARNIRRKDLRQVSRGEYSLATFGFGNENPAWVFVHPLYEFNVDRRCRLGVWPNDYTHPTLVRRLIEQREPYLRRFQRTVLEEKGPIVVMVEYSKLTRTAGYFHWLGRFDDVCFIETENHTPTPKSLSWESVFSFLEELSSHPLMLGGGYWINDWAWKEFPNNMGGCLAELAQRLHKEKIDFDVAEGLTFGSR